MTDLQLQLDLAIRLVLSAVFGAGIGFEREIHGHPAGMRTHLLVSLGSALFTVLSIYGFGPPEPGAPVDPSRVAAQIVSGIGFLGAGAILKEGLSIRGLTTAASLWATAAVGLAAGAGQWLLALIGTVIVIFSLGPLSWVAGRVRGIEKQLMTLRLEVADLDALAPVFARLTEHRLEIIGVRTERDRRRFDVELDVRVRGAANLPAALEAVARVDGVTLEHAGGERTTNE
jgi:putative Mg2+ transporter-C (MgtC) family protein